MKKIHFSLILITLLSQPLDAETSAPIAQWQWGTYSNVDYGFSVRYPLRYGLYCGQMDCADLYGNHEISLPTTYEKAGLSFAGLTEKDGGVSDGMKGIKPFIYSLSRVRRALELPLDSSPPDFKDARVISLDGVKALRLKVNGTNIFNVFYLIPRKGDRWLEITEHTSAKTGPEQKRELAAQEALVGTLRLIY